MTSAANTALQQHPLSARFPSMPEGEFGALVLDIESHGQREPGIIFEDMVLDGWHRYRACQQLGIKFKSRAFDGADPRTFVKSYNLHRRHMTGTQRAEAVVGVNEWAPVGRPGKGEATSPFSTVASMASEAEVSERTIQHVKKAHEAGLGDAMRDGVVTAQRAAEIADLPKKDRKRALKEPKPPKERKPRVIAADPKFEKLYGEVKSDLAATKESLAEMADLAASAKAFEEKQEFKEMQVLRLELRSCKRRRDELMAENAQLKSEVKRWRKKAEAK